MIFKIGKVFSLISILIASDAFAASYPVPAQNKSIIGQINSNTLDSGQTVVSVSEKYDLGYNAIAQANPQYDMAKRLPSNATLKLPTQHLLPNQPREGIVVNLPEMRMYYFVPGTSKVATYPIGIGRIGKTIPLAQAKITKKVKDPAWIPPDDIREFNLAQGVILPQVMPAGPDNPLGPYAIYMSVPTFLIHSTIFPESVGKRASFGCLRMFESDIKDFFPSIKPGLPVAIVNAPVKVGWEDNHLYMEAHMPLEEHSDEMEARLPGTVKLIQAQTEKETTFVDWQAVSFMEKERDGLPHEIGFKLPA